LIISERSANTGVAFAVSSKIVKQIVPALIGGND
jgi:hypothetical protein